MLLGKSALVAVDVYLPMLIQTVTKSIVEEASDVQNRTYFWKYLITVLSAARLFFKSLTAISYRSHIIHIHKRRANEGKYVY